MSKIYDFFLNLWKTNLNSDLHWIIRGFLALLLLCIMAFPFEIVVMVIVGIVENGWVSIILSVTTLLSLSWAIYLNRNKVSIEEFNMRDRLLEHQRDTNHRYFAESKEAFQNLANKYGDEKIQAMQDSYKQKLEEIQKQYENRFTEFKADFEKRSAEEIDRLAREKAKEYINKEMPFDL